MKVTHWLPFLPWLKELFPCGALVDPDEHLATVSGRVTCGLCRRIRDAKMRPWEGAPDVMAP